MTTTAPVATDHAPESTTAAPTRPRAALRVLVLSTLVLHADVRRLADVRRARHPDPDRVRAVRQPAGLDRRRRDPQRIDLAAVPRRADRPDRRPGHHDRDAAGHGGPHLPGRVPGRSPTACCWSWPSSSGSPATCSASASPGTPPGSPGSTRASRSASSEPATSAPRSPSSSGPSSSRQPPVASTSAA